MADYYPLIARAISGLDASATGEQRELVDLLRGGQQIAFHALDQPLHGDEVGGGELYPAHDPAPRDGPSRSGRTTATLPSRHMIVSTRWSIRQPAGVRTRVSS